MNEKEQINTELEKFLKDNPDLQEVMKLFGETMSTYNEILAAMGQQQTYQITAGNTAQGTLHLCASTTSSFKIPGK